MDPRLLASGVLLSLPVAYFLQRAVSSNTLKRALPPGPSGLPIVGNILDWPKEKEWLTFSQWAETYGDIVYVNLAGAHVVILNSQEHAAALLEAKNIIYSDRPQAPFAQMTLWNKIMGALPDGPRLKQSRRFIAQEMGTKATLIKFEPLMESQARNLVRRILDNPTPDMLPKHVRKFSGGTILDVAYGYQVPDGKDRMIDLAERGMFEFQESITPGAHLVDTFPWLKYLPSWLPGMNFKTRAAQIRRNTEEYIDIPYQYVLSQMAAGCARPSFVSNFLQNAESSLLPEDLDIMKWTAGSIYGAGADTTVAVIYGFFYEMMCNPEAQRRAQDEIDDVLGADASTLPTLANRSQLPYVEALVKEVFRCVVVGPQSVVHLLTADDIHEGYFLPKGTNVITNIWYMLHDPRRYNNPSRFNPDRFLGENPEPDPRNFLFGHGRRVCPGKLFADQSVFLAITTVLATLNISKALDANGQEITPEADYVGGVIIHLRKYPVQLKPRSAQSEAAIRAAVA